LNHSFNVEIATILNSVEKAILIENIAFWILKNKSSKKNFYDGHYWTYNSAEGFTELFPYWSRKKIQNKLKELENDGFLKVGCYNKSAYDRTKWYTITNEKIRKFYPLDCPILDNEKDRKDQPIPDINTNINLKKKKKEKSFSAPTLENVKEYGLEKAREMNKNFNPLVFFNYYEATNWKGVKNWKQRLVNWLGREKESFKETKETRISKGQDHLLDLGDL